MNMSSKYSKFGQQVHDKIEKNFKTSSKEDFNKTLGSMNNIFMGSLAIRGVLNMIGEKMFGNTSQLPKGVVREMMEGIMSGIIDHVNSKDYEINELREKIQAKEELIKQKDEEIFQKKIQNTELSDLINRLKEKQTKTKKKKETKK